MDEETTTKSGSQPSTGQSPQSRTQRGAIAAQACDTCRSRKQKCDEQRPKCGTCQKFKLECRYREPQPTKKDKTLIEILDRIKALEGKMDSLSAQGTVIPSVHGSISGASLVQTPTPIVSSGSGSSTYAPPSLSEIPSSTGGATLYKYASSVHAMFDWPVIQQLLNIMPNTLASDASTIQQQHGTSPLIGIHNSTPLTATGPTDVPHPSSLESQALGSSPAAVPQVINALTWETMQSLSKAYFDTLNLLHPIIDRQTFVGTTLPAILANGLDDSIQSTLAYLVFALGEVAIAGIQGPPVGIYNGRPSGVRGGSPAQPPGLALFNEARRRMGFNLTDCSLENIQIFALTGVYYETCFHHTDLWRMTTLASLACQALIMSNPGELTSPRGDIIRRVFWHCSIMETFLDLELGISTTGLDKFEAFVRVPDFGGVFLQEDYISNQATHFREHFASHIVLRRLSTDFHKVLSTVDELTNAILVSTSSIASTAVTASPLPVMPEAIKPLTMQLDHWRETLLPVHLRWRESNPEMFPSQGQDIYSVPVFPAVPPMGPRPDPTTTATGSSMFTTDLDAQPVAYPYVMDIQAALLRTRYYVTKHIIHRPFLYKALHHPDQVSQADAEGVAICLRACLRWPLTMSPACTRKRLIPCVFFWTQNLLGVLLVLHLSRQTPLLMRIRATLCGDGFVQEERDTVSLYCDWIRDLSTVDEAARWAWEMVRVVYGLDVQDGQ